MPRILLTQGIRLSSMIIPLWIAGLIHTVVRAQEVQPIFGKITIDHKFSPDPLVYQGISGGDTPGNQVVKKGNTHTGACTGFMDESPNYTLTLLNKFDYLKLIAESTSDTTMIVVGPGGTWCNDDLDGKNPGIVGEWLPGIYNVWIGSYIKGQYLPYKLKITEVK
jgi:hypothetical protein